MKWSETKPDFFHSGTERAQGIVRLEGNSITRWQQEKRRKIGENEHRQFPRHPFAPGRHRHQAVHSVTSAQSQAQRRASSDQKIGLPNIVVIVVVVEYGESVDDDRRGTQGANAAEGHRNGVEFIDEWRPALLEEPLQDYPIRLGLLSRRSKVNETQRRQGNGRLLRRVALETGRRFLQLLLFENRCQSKCRLKDQTIF